MWHAGKRIDVSGLMRPFQLKMAKLNFKKKGDIHKINVQIIFCVKSSYEGMYQIQVLVFYWISRPVRLVSLSI
jgi:hypothetical protein